MATVAALARLHTDLDDEAVVHLQGLIASWGLLSDLCFADLMLFSPVTGSEDEFVVLGHVRPTTSQTLYREDWVGQVVSGDDRPLVPRAWKLDTIVNDETHVPYLGMRVRVLCIPVRHKGRLVGIMSREAPPHPGREMGELERIYLEIFQRFARMIVAGSFPFAVEDAEVEEAPRVGDGVMVLDAAGRVEFASPNAVSALHRAGVHQNAEGMRMNELGLEETAVRTAFAVAAPCTEEVEPRPGVTVLVRCIPMVERDSVSGGLLLMRDVSELRRRDRMLMTKDATIREIHHRVKNNLQTISSLLRLQARRLQNPDGKAALEDAVRRISSIAKVHETLSKEGGDEVAFIEVVTPLVRTVQDGWLGPDRQVSFTIEGDAGRLPAIVATPLSVVVNELLQNVVDHAYPVDDTLSVEDGDEPVRGHVTVFLEGEGDDVLVRITDDGAGVPEGFTLDRAGLGLSIVRTLVTSELGGTIDLRPGTIPGPSGNLGTVAEVRLSLAEKARYEPGRA